MTIKPNDPLDVLRHHLARIPDTDADSREEISRALEDLSDRLDGIDKALRNLCNQNV